jgi:DNA-binding response OmpR family regulator
MSSLPKNILFVTSDDRYSDTINRQLNREEENYSLTTARTADQALFLMKDEPFDLYILDYLLEGISAEELFRRLREKDQQTPVLFFSRLNNPVSEDFEQNSNGNLHHPNELDRLAEMVERLLSKTSSASMNDA